MKGVFVGIEAVVIDFGIKLSEPLEECFGKICEKILNVLIGMKGAVNRA